jgi:hypothetical protein
VKFRNRTWLTGIEREVIDHGLASGVGKDGREFWFSVGQLVDPAPQPERLKKAVNRPNKSDNSKQRTEGEYFTTEPVKSFHEINDE